MIIYRSWDGSDMANSDTYYSTLKETVAGVREDYDIKGPIKLDAEGEWEGRAGANARLARYDVHIERLEITPTREGLCHALKHIPHR